MGWVLTADKKDTSLFINCQKCKASFDYLSVPEKGMGYVECPSCKSLLNQYGKDVTPANLTSQSGFWPEKLKKKLPIKYYSNIEVNQGTGEIKLYDTESRLLGDVPTVQKLIEKVKTDRPWENIGIRPNQDTIDLETKDGMPVGSFSVQRLLAGAGFQKVAAVSEGAPSPVSTEQRVTQDEWDTAYKDYGDGIKVGEPFTDRYGEKCPTCDSQMVRFKDKGWMCLWCKLQVTADGKDTGSIGYSSGDSYPAQDQFKPEKFPEGQPWAWFSVVTDY